MRVTIVNSVDTYGGAAKAAYRLHQELRCINIDSRMLVQKKKSNDASVVGPTSYFEKGLNKLRPIIDGLPLKLYKNREKALWGLSWLPNNIPKKIRVSIFMPPCPSEENRKASM